MSLSIRTFGARLSGALFGDGDDGDKARPALALDMLSDYLPYRYFDAEREVFLNSASLGFVLVAAPLVGADERTGEILGQFFSEGMPSGACLQIVNLQSPRIGRLLAPWFQPRFLKGGVYERMASARVKAFSNMVWESGSADAPFHARHFQLFISVGLPEPSSSGTDDLIACREGLLGALRSLDIPVRVAGPEDIIALVDDLTSPTTAPSEDELAYNKYDPLDRQMIRRDIALDVRADRMMLDTERFRATGKEEDGISEIGEIYPDRFDIRHYGVRSMPERWAPWECARLIGDLFTDKLRFPCPAATMLCLIYPDQDGASAKAGMKFMRKTSLAEGRSARFLPNIGKQAAEWSHVKAELGEGRRLVELFYGLTAYSPDGMGDRNERTIRSIYKSAGWDLSDERFLQIQGLLAAMPLTLADGLAVDMKRLKRLRTMLSTTAANIAPLQGEYLGGGVPHMLLIGRRGQPFFWSPFENAAGNHNVAICGKSGSGKSVLLQELCAAMRGAGADLVVIDDGRSFEHSARLQGGDFIEFTLKSGFCLNPFSMVDEARAANDEDYRLDCLTMIKGIVGQMARHIGTLNDTERGLIDAAVGSVWQEEARSGSIDAVASALAEADSPLAADLAIALSPFRSSGTYGGFFNGEATLKLKSAFTVFEMSDLSTREELRSVVLSAVMFMTSQAMTQGPRDRRKLLLIDEAWSMLRGGSMGDFVETYARTCRKYGGALATATQSLNDYYKSDGAAAALENSDWMLVLQQKPETIADFRKNDRLDMDERNEGLIRSLKRNGTEYSEVFIKGPDVQTVGRLVLDPFSAIVFSSSPSVFAEIEARQAAGATMSEAIEAVARQHAKETKHD